MLLLAFIDTNVSQLIMCKRLGILREERLESVLKRLNKSRLIWDLQKIMPKQHQLQST